MPRPLYPYALAFALVTCAGSLHAQEAILRFTTAGYSPQYPQYPQNVLAVWVTDGQDSYVKTLYVMGSLQSWFPGASGHEPGEWRNCLVRWKNSTTPFADSADAITGATLPNHQARTVRWDCRDRSGNPASDGTYRMWIEMADHNAFDTRLFPPGPYTYVQFNKGVARDSVRRPDVVHLNTTVFSNISVAYDPGTPSAGTLQFSAAGYAAGEGDGMATVAVTRTGGSSGVVSVNYRSSDVSAAAGVDYTAASGTVTFGDGVTGSQTFTIGILEDLLEEGDEVVGLSLFSASGSATIGPCSTAVLTIHDNDISVRGSVVGRWRFEEGTGAVAYDSSGGGNDGTVNGALWTSGIAGQALEFDGATSHVDVPHDPALAVVGDLTLSAWIRPAALPSSGVWIILSKQSVGSSTLAPYQLALRSDGSLRFYHQDSPATSDMVDMSPSPLVTPNSWNHVVAVRDAAARTVSFYVNGTADAGNPHPYMAGGGDSGAYLRIGSHNAGDRWFRGGIDEVAVFALALNASQVDSLYASAGTVAASGRRAHVAQSARPRAVFDGRRVVVDLGSATDGIVEVSVWAADGSLMHSRSVRPDGTRVTAVFGAAGSARGAYLVRVVQGTREYVCTVVARSSGGGMR